MKCRLSAVVVVFSILLLPGCSEKREEGQEQLSREAKLQHSLDRINKILESSKAHSFQDTKRLKEIKAGLEEELGLRQPDNE
ncbi:hypothetical protein [Nitrosococcus wardiae]|uniref:hypothetical protein n=1 Tax=Nitrosococcus wardiae TaxID=1814290 RepID=UPI00141B3311|nr:hypothetical protein [Nitrosococcus wardiae]